MAYLGAAQAPLFPVAHAHPPRRLGLYSPVASSGIYGSTAHRYAAQISPGKNMGFPCTTAPHAHLGGHRDLYKLRANLTEKEIVMSNETGTVRLHRVLRAPAERIYKAFTDKSALERWLPPFGFTGTIHEIDIRVGGGYRMSFTNFGTGSSHSFTVEYVELVPNEHIRHKDRFDDESFPGEMVVSIDLKTVSCGTDISIVQVGIPSVIPVEMCYLGWQESLEQLTRLVEPDIPDNG